MVFVFLTPCRGRLPVGPWREAPMPPLEGEVVKRQRNRRGLYVNRAVQENPSVSPFGLPAPLSGAPRALRAGAFLNRFLSGNEPSGLGNQRIGTAFAASLSDDTAVILTYPPRLSIQEWGLCGQNLQKTQQYEIIVNCQLRLWVWESIIELIIIQKCQPAKKAGAASQKGRQTHESCSARPDQDLSCP